MLSLGRTWKPRGAIAAAIAASAALIAAQLPATAAVAPRTIAPRGWQVTSGAFGIMGGVEDGSALTSVRTWDTRANWCDIQPTPDADMVANLERLLAPRLDVAVGRGTTSAIISLGHPAPWVFDNHPKAVKSAKVWSCGNHAAGISIPSAASLKDGSVQWNRFQEYARTVMAFVAQRYGTNLAVAFQVYNEPNLASGLDPRLKIPGAARSATEAATSLYAYERIAQRLLAGEFANTGYALMATALYQRPSAFTYKYLSLHNRNRLFSSLAFNIYGWKKKTPDGMVSEWNSKAWLVRKTVNRYSKLRRLPIYITETNHNLVNNNHDRSNLKSVIGAASTQVRLATGTQMDAFFHGFSGVYWLGPWRHQQAAVRVTVPEGSPARDALIVLRSGINGRVLVSCSASKVRTCTFRDPTGVRGDLRIMWRTSGSATVRIPATTVTYMNGASEQAAGSIKVGTTPIMVG